MNIPDELWASKPARFPHPDWETIADRVDAETLDNSGKDALWREGARLWMDRFASVLGTHYRVAASENFLLVTCAGQKRIGDVLRFLEECLREIRATLPFLCDERPLGSCPVIVFADENEYYEYLADFFDVEEGNFAGSGGVYLNRGYGHFAAPSENLESYRAVMCHELCHALVAHLRLPLWLDEAVTGEVEHAVVGENPYIFDRQRAREHREYWNPERLGEFFDGASFYDPDGGQELSYHLARFLFHAIAGRSNPQTMARFLTSGDWEDGGFSAVRRHFDLDLSDVLDGLLG